MTIRYPITCPVCGHSNSEGLFCGLCEAQLAPPGEIERNEKLCQRPLFVVVYDVVSIVIGIIMLVVAVAWPGTSWVSVGLASAILAFVTVLAVGLWKQQNWARLAALSALCLLFALILIGALLVGGAATDLHPLFVPGTAVTLLVVGFVIFWFMRNFQYFE